MIFAPPAQLATLRRLRRVVLAAYCAAAAVAYARNKAPPGLYDSYTGFALPATPVLPAREVHPSLWFKASDVPGLRLAKTRDDFARARWTAVLAMADLGSTPPSPPTGRDKVETIHRYYGGMSIAARAHALLALLADDPTERAAHQARAQELLLRAYDGPIFQLDSNQKGSAVDEIYRGSWLQNYAHAYDCIQSSLTPEADRAIRARLALEAQCVYDHLYEWTPDSPHNHLSKPAWGLGSIALAMASDERAKSWLGRALEASNRNTRYFFSGDGLYREGSHYLIFSLTNFLPFLYHYRNVSGVDGFPVFQPVFEAMVEARNSRGWLPNIADSYLRPTPTHLAAIAYRQARTRLSSHASLAEILAWSYASCDLGPFEAERHGSGLNYTGASWDYPLEIDELLTHDGAIRPVEPDAPPNVFLAGGQSYFRTGWSGPSAGQRYLLFHGMASADNHQHDDHLSFILEAEGQMMCSDSGYSRGTYVGAERTNWYVTAPAHNTLTFDGHAAGDAAPNRTPPSLFRADIEGLVGEEKEAVFGPDATWRRAILWIANDYYVVYDRMNAGHAGAISAYLHGGRGRLDPDHRPYAWTYQKDQYGGAACLRAWIAAPGAEVTVKSGELTYIKGDYASFPYLQIDGHAADCGWLTLLKPGPAEGPAAFAVEDVSTAAVSALSIGAGRERSLVLAQPRGGGRVQVGDVVTDAALALVSRDGESNRVVSYCVLEATKLSVGGREIWHSAQPANHADADR